MSYEWRFDVVWESLPFLLEGLWVTVLIVVACMGISLILGLLLALARISSHAWLRLISAAYIDFFRGVPLLVLVFWAFFTVPIATGQPLPAIPTGIIAMSINLTAFVAEIYRAGIQSVTLGQRHAALSLGMTQSQALQRVILPQAVRHVVPPVASAWVSLFKDTALLSVIIVPELMYQARILAVQTYRPLEIYTVIALVYFVITWPQARFADWIYERMRVRD
ncbi:MAG: amino acid ABC transporter permease [Chloroflexota bacterium]|nr:amino acid ABC transporter permease [Chloroflexota bacterium]